ncbi:Hypothetical predicted protein, partial [Paramuricea clavata]
RVSTSDVRLQHTSEPLQKCEIGFDLVDNQSTIAEGKSHSASNCRSNNLIRCFQNRLGSILGEISDRRTVEYPRFPGSHKHPGNQGSLLCPEVVREGSDQQGDWSEDRQFDCSSISEQQRRDPLPSVTAANIGDMELVRDKTPFLAQHVPGKNNVVADEESRKMRDHNDWKIDSTVIRQFIKKCQIDLFASRLTRQLNRYVSWRPDPGAIHVDAFTMNWTNLNA